MTTVSLRTVRSLAACTLIAGSSFVAGCTSAPRSAFDTTEGTPSSTIRHVVLIDLKDAGDATRLIEAMDADLAPIPGILSYWRGTPHQSGRPEVQANYDVALILDFRDAAAYSTYSNHPKHVGLVTEWKPRLNSLTIYDVRPNAERR